jgi:NADH:quinone reductase (non-electrogenic)
MDKKIHQQVRAGGAYVPLVVIVGAGFGGLQTARKLAHAPLRVLLLDKRNYHLFQPLLYQIATAGISPGEIAHPVRGILGQQKNFQFHMAEVRQFDLENRQLKTNAGSFDYDYLVIAVGAETNHFGIESVGRNALDMKDLDDAIDIRNKVLCSFELADQEPDSSRRRELLTFVVVGGGPTGVETAGALSELIRLVLVKDYPQLDLEEVRILLLEASNQILSGFPARLREKAVRTLEDKHIEVRCNAAVQGYDGHTIILKNAEPVQARTMIWAAGVRAASLLDRSGLQQARQGRLVVGPTLQLERYPEVFVIGDAAYLEADGQPLQMMATVAMQEGAFVAENIRRLVQTEPLRNFRYQDPGSLATIGRNQAVIRLGRLSFSGFIAWLIWVVVHIYRLIGFRSRFLVMINWIWDYFMYERGIRLITPYGKRCQEQPVENSR